MRIIHIFFYFFIFITIAFAEDDESFLSNIYFGTEINRDVLTNSKSSNYDLFGNSVKVGYKINEKVSIELNSGSSIFDKNDNRLDNSLTLNGRMLYDGYDIDFLNLKKEETHLFSTFGFSSTEISSVNSEKTSSELSPMFGLGFEYQYSEVFSFYVGYNFLSLDVSQFNIGLNYYFSKNKTVDYKEAELQKAKEDEKKERDKLIFANMTVEEKIKFEKMLNDEREQNSTLDDRLNDEKRDIDFDDNKTRLNLKLLHKEEIKEPILIYLYELSSIDEFKRLDYEETIVLKKGDLSGAVLGQVKFLLEPLKMESFNLVLKEDTRFFAVVAAIDDDNDNERDEKDIDEWRWIQKTTPHKVTDIKLMFNHTKITEFK